MLPAVKMALRVVTIVLGEATTGSTGRLSYGSPQWVHDRQQRGACGRGMEGDGRRQAGIGGAKACGAWGLLRRWGRVGRDLNRTGRCRRERRGQEMRTSATGLCWWLGTGKDAGRCWRVRSVRGAGGRRAWIRHRMGAISQRTGATGLQPTRRRRRRCTMRTMMRCLRRQNWRCSGLRVSDLGLSDGGMASDGICGRIPLIHPSEASARCSVHPCETPRLSGRSERCSRALAPTHSADWREGGATLGSSATASRFIESADTSVTGGCKDCGALRTELQTALALLCDARERVRAREREVLALQHQHAHERARIREHYEALLRPLLQQNRHGHVCYSEPMEGVTHEHAHGRALAVAEVSHLEPQAHVPSSLCFPPAQGDSASLGHGARDAVWEAPLLLRGDSESEVPESKPLALAPLPLSPPLSPFSEDERAVVLTPLRSRGGGSSA